MIKKLGRNDHCWCGSGKKYKACHEAFDDKLRYLEDIGHIVPSHKLIKTPEQIEKIKNYFEAAKKVGMNDFDDLWDIDETNFNINGFTCMNNGDMLKFLRLIGVDRDNIEWEELS